MQLSVASAVYNEEKNIIRCLESVYDWVDEIVLVDGSSTDQTISLVREFDSKRKIKIFIEENPPLFIINKQKAIDRCQGEWILELDADEVVTEKLKKEIQLVISQELVQSNNSDQLYPVAYQIPRLNYFLGTPLRKGGQYPDYKLRLYQKGTAHFPLKTIHDQVVIDHKKPMGTLHSPLLHHPYPTFEVYIRKWIQYSMFEAETIYKEGVRASFGGFVKYMIGLPLWWFLTTYIRHKGFQDGFAGFSFALFSSIRYWVIYMKLEERV